MQQLNEAQNIEERVDLFAKWTDKFGFEAVLSRVPILGDIGPAIISTGFLFDQGRKMGLGRMEMLKIFGYQTVDAVLGAIPLVGNVIDFFFKSNKYSSKVFEKHVEKLKKAAIEKGATQEEIAELDRVSKQTMNKLDEQTNNKGTTENGQQNGNRGNENGGTGRKVDSKALNKEKIEQIEKKLNTTVNETTDKVDSRVNGAVKIEEKVDRIEEKIDKL